MAVFDVCRCIARQHVACVYKYTGACTYKIVFEFFSRSRGHISRTNRYYVGLVVLLAHRTPLYSFNYPRNRTSGTPPRGNSVFVSEVLLLFFFFPRSKKKIVAFSHVPDRRDICRRCFPNDARVCDTPRYTAEVGRIVRV